MNHYHYLRKNDIFTSGITKIETVLFWFYNKLTDYFEDVKGLF